MALPRPELHFAPARTWANDPNGLIWHDGDWHLFFQNNPFGVDWGNMSWGHATSPDLVHWTELPVALPCSDSEEIFSGSCVFDSGNSSGLGTEEAPPLVAIYTANYRPGSARFGTQAQALASSADGGITWTPYPGNPVTDRGSKDFRDPKVSRYQDHWLMVAVEAEDQYVVFYRSHNLIDWTYLSSFGPAHATDGAWECPDLFPLPVEGTNDQRWLLVVSINPGAVSGGGGTQYFLGDFDGVTFTADHLLPAGDLRSFGWLDHGRDFYAAVSFADVPDGRRILLGWMNNWDYCRDVPLTGGRSVMTSPRELSLIERDGQPVLRQLPARELFRALGAPVTLMAEAGFEGSRRLERTVRTGILQLRLGSPAERFELLVGGVAITVMEGVLSVDRSRAGRRDFHPAFASRTWVDLPKQPMAATGLELTVVIDTCSLEVFAADGAVALTNLVYFESPEQDIEVRSDGPVELELTLRSR